jgi:hypothetical protein
MYKLTLMLFALLSLILPVLTVPVPIPEEIEELEKRNTHSGRVRVLESHPAFWY